MSVNDRVALTIEARSRFPDIGTRAGTVARVDGWIVVKLDGVMGESRLPEADWERIET